MVPMPHGSTVRLRALATACAGSLVVGLTVEWVWRWFAVVVLHESAALASLQSSAILLSAVVPVLGNGLGYFMTYRRSSRPSRLVFAGPSALLAGVGLTVALAQLPASPGTRAVAVTVVIALITPVVTVAVLLTRRDLLRPDPPGRVSGRA